MKNIAVFASGNGTNFEAIVQATLNGEIAGKVVLMVSDKPNAYVVKRAINHHISTFTFRAKDYDSKEMYERDILKQLQANKVDLICLAGYMRIIGPTLLDSFPNKIINIHPSLLPAFKGSPHAIEDAYSYGVKVFGVSIHFVNMEVDGGSVIAQAAFPYNEGDTLEEVENKIHGIEHPLYVKTIKKLCEE